MAFWIPFLIAVALQAVAYVLTPKPSQPTPAAAETVEIPTVQEGSNIPVLFGTRVIKGPNVVWYGDIKTVAVKKKGGKK